MNADRRRHPRFPCLLMGDVAPVGGAATSVVCTSISRGGAYFSCKVSQQPGAELVATMRSQGSAGLAIVMVAEVMRVVPRGQPEPPGFGVRWKSVACVQGPEPLLQFVREQLRWPDPPPPEVDPTGLARYLVNADGVWIGAGKASAPATAERRGPERISQGTPIALGAGPLAPPPAEFRDRLRLPFQSAADPSAADPSAIRRASRPSLSPQPWRRANRRPRTRTAPHRALGWMPSRLKSAGLAPSSTAGRGRTPPPPSKPLRRRRPCLPPAAATRRSPTNHCKWWRQLQLPGRRRRPRMPSGPWRWRRRWLRPPQPARRRLSPRWQPQGHQPWRCLGQVLVQAGRCRQPPPRRRQLPTSGRRRPAPAIPRQNRTCPGRPAAPR